MFVKSLFSGVLMEEIGLMLCTLMHLAHCVSADSEILLFRSKADCSPSRSPQCAGEELPR